MKSPSVMKTRRRRPRAAVVGVDGRAANEESGEEKHEEKQLDFSSVKTFPFVRRFLMRKSVKLVVGVLIFPMYGFFVYSGFVIARVFECLVKGSATLVFLTGILFVVLPRHWWNEVTEALFEVASTAALLVIVISIANILRRETANEPEHHHHPMFRLKYPK